MASPNYSGWMIGQLVQHTDRGCYGTYQGVKNNKIFIQSDSCGSGYVQYPHKWVAVKDTENELKDDPYQNKQFDSTLITNRYFMQATSEVVEYWERITAPGYSHILANFIKHIHKDENSSVCWGDYLNRLSFTSYIDKISRFRDIFALYPNMDKYYQTNQTRVSYTYDSPYFVTFDNRNDFIALGFPNLLMIDFDFDLEKDSREEAITKAKQKLESIGCNLNFKWVLFDTDRGLHAFLVSHEANYREMEWIHLMLYIDADPWYAAFTHVFGWQIRLNAKKERPNDFVAKPHPNGYENSGKTLPKTSFFPQNIEPNDIKQNLLQSVIFHSLLTQNLSHMSGEKLNLLKCAIGDTALKLKQKQIRGTSAVSYENKYINTFRKKIKALWDTSKIESVRFINEL